MKRRLLLGCAGLLLLLILLLAAGAVAVWKRDQIFAVLAERKIKAMTGMEASVGRLETRFLDCAMTLENVVVVNPPDFGGSPLIDLKELYFQGYADDLAAERLRFKEVRLNISEINLVESKDGRTNIADVFGILQNGIPEPEKDSEKEIPFLGIDRLELTFGKVKFTSLREPARNTEFNVGLKNEVLTNVTSMTNLNALMFKVLFRHGVTILSNPEPPRRRELPLEKPEPQ